MSVKEVSEKLDRLAEEIAKNSNISIEEAEDQVIQTMLQRYKKNPSPEGKEEAKEEIKWAIKKNKFTIDGLTSALKDLLGEEDPNINDKEIRLLSDIIGTAGYKEKDYFIRFLLDGIRNPLGKDPVFIKEVQNFIHYTEGLTTKIIDKSQETARKDIDKAILSSDIKFGKILKNFIYNNSVKEEEFERQLRSFSAYHYLRYQIEKDQISKFCFWMESQASRSELFSQRARWLAVWAANGFPEVRIEDKVAAALILTDIPGELINEDVNIPWPAFSVQVPEGIIPEIESGFNHVRMRIIKREDAQFKWCLLIQGIRHDGQLKEISRESSSLAGLTKELDDTQSPILLNSEEEETLEGEELEFINRVGGLLGKLMIGIILRMTDRSLLRKRSNKARFHGKGRVIGPPQTTEWVLGGEVKIDCRQAVQEMFLGKREVKYKKVQWIVRGHWRNQPFGKGRTQSRRQWIEPFWKGPEKMPILVRAHSIQDDPEKLR